MCVSPPTNRNDHYGDGILGALLPEGVELLRLAECGEATTYEASDISTGYITTVDVALID